MNAISDKIRGFFMHRSPGARTRQLGEDDHLLENGILDSLGVLDLVEYLEKEFQITVADDDLLPENFKTLAVLAAFVKRRIPSTAPLD